MLNEQLKSIWTECFDPKSQVLAPLYFDDIISGGVACVGMNPSFDERTINRFLREFRPNKNSNARQLFSWTGPDQDISSLCIEEQMYAKRTIQYYQFHREIFESSNLPWYQLDLYRYRASKQLEMDEVCKANPHFSKKSLELFNDALRIYQPKAILVLNAAVVRKFESTYECKYDDQLQMGASRF